jgi:hypothetical protein
LGTAETMQRRKGAMGPQLASQSQGTEEERLDRALVTGLMMEVILESSTLQVDPQIHCRLVKNRLKTEMATRLAGRVTLKRFHRLLQEVDHSFPRYYSLIAPGSSEAPAAGPKTTASPFAVPSAPTPRVLRQDTLKDWLEAEVRELLPQRSHRKLSARRLLDFLQNTRGGWFRLKDFEQHFGVDRKTAWEYLQKFLTAGLLCHNHRRSAAVRYALATRFLVVRVDALRPIIRETLPELPLEQADQICDWLAATGGEPFGEETWQFHLKQSRCRQVIAKLEAAGLLEEVSLAGLGQMHKLARRWLQD